MISSIHLSPIGGPDTLKHQEKLHSLVGIPSDPKAMMLEYVGDFIPPLAVHFSFLEPILMVIRKLNGTDPLGCCFSGPCSVGDPEKCATMQMVKHVAICMERISQLSQDTAASSTGANHLYPVTLEQYLIELGQPVSTLQGWHNFCVNSETPFFVSVFSKCEAGDRRGNFVFLVKKEEAEAMHVDKKEEAEAMHVEEIG